MVVNASGSLVARRADRAVPLPRPRPARARRRRRRALRGLHHVVDRQLGDGAPRAHRPPAARRSSTRWAASSCVSPPPSPGSAWPGWPDAPARSGGEGLGRRARAHQVAVPVGLVDPRHGRPVLGGRAAGGEHCRRPVIGTRSHSTRPATAAVCGAPRSGLSSSGQRPDATSSISARMAIMASQKRSSSLEVLALGGLHHHGARHREAHRRRVEAVVDQPLRHVVDRDPGGLASVAAGRRCTRGPPARSLPGVEDRVRRGEPRWRRSWQPAPPTWSHAPVRSPTAGGCRPS